MRHQPGQTVDRYEIVEAMGEGAYAETYKARDTKTGNTVLLKCPNPMLFADPKLYQRFMREAEIAQQLRDPHVQRSLDVAEHTTEPYLVLEYVEGENLRTHLKRYPDGVPLETAIDWGRQLAQALASLHERGITHRDLKPENIVITADGTLKIVDFGSALLAGARRLTWRHLSETMGTPDYMSPEQIQGDRGDPRSDIYAWGVLMYELLTGSVPFEGDNWLAVMAGHMQRTPRKLRQWRPEVPPGIEVVVLKAMRRYPINRYQSANDILADLDRLDEIGPSTYDLSEEKPMGGMAAVGSAKRLWLYAAGIAAAFISIVALIIVLTVVLK